MKPLASKVAVVAGATRGAGRGIAHMLGEAGATVFCTGRSTRESGATPGRPETIEETAELVTRAGGRGIAVRVDHTAEAEVVGLFEAIRADAGRLDILVNDVWGGDDLTEWGTPFWETDLGKGRRMIEAAVWSHILTARHALPLMVEGNSGLVVEITDGDFLGYRGAFFYDLAKASGIRIAYALAAELLDTGITALALTPGFLRSEAMLARFGVTEENWREGARVDPHFIESETPCFVGRAVVALAQDPQVRTRAGRVFASWTLAREYGFTDIDGRSPDWGRYFEALTAEIASRGPRNEDERFLLRMRAFQLDFDPAITAEAQRLRGLIGAK
ncbi:MAG: SDR family NAD(P)-dependent oxidoreductase [Vicinamibacteria bacterium]|nr:SDR family NAD(P)-dependent oxidoreductase [Vicinamibacteria bacterium]